MTAGGPGRDRAATFHDAGAFILADSEMARRIMPMVAFNAQGSPF